MPRDNASRFPRAFGFLLFFIAFEMVFEKRQDRKEKSHAIMGIISTTSRRFPAYP
jgi:small neutral amino acid transporter SnatA (MarC family)